VREISVPALVAARPQANLTDLIVENAEAFGHLVGYRRRGADDLWHAVTWSVFRDEVEAVAKGLVASGVQAGDRVTLMARTRYEWTLIDVAIWFAGAVTVPIYETSSIEQVQWILSDSDARLCVVEAATHQATVTAAQQRGAPAVPVLVIDDGAVASLTAAGRDVPDDEIARRRATLDGSSIATLIYTSGTTGRPKGCELTHANFFELSVNTVQHLAQVVRADNASTLLFLPLAHVFARFIQVLCIAARAELGHSPDVKNLLGDLAGFRPSFILAVPRVFEKIYNSAEASATADGKGKIFASAARTATAYSEALDAGGPSLGLKARHLVFDRLVYSKLRNRMGGQVAYAVSGGAALGTRLGHFFRGAGISVLEGWGLTETTAPATVNTPDDFRIGTVGRPLPGVDVAISDDGELLVRGVNVMTGYYQNDEATAQALNAGWFHTGDIGEIDTDGFVRITGRKKEIIVTAAGKNVAPAVLEDRLRGHPLVSQCIVVGEQRPFIGALVTLDDEMLGTWLAARDRSPLTVKQATTDPDVRAAVQLAVDDANLAVSKAESIRSFVLLDIDFTEAGGHLTPKLSIKRAVVTAEFADAIEGIYSGGGGQ
jgi:long-chain acyl-CoA synthetase